MKEKIPFIDLKEQYLAIKEDIDRAMRRVLDGQAFVLGEEVQEFEKNFAAYCGTAECVGVSSGTDALYLSLKALGIGTGDEVITTPFTFIGTALAISKTGATPVFADCREDDFNLDPDKVEDAVTQKTKAIIPVHLYGQPADMDPILAVAERHNLEVVEDACQAHGAEYKGKRVGSMGKLGCFSFYPTKNLGAFGDGGAITTNDKALAKKLRMLRNAGQKERYRSLLKGDNCRLDSLQAAILNVKLEHLEEWNEQRRERAQYYDNLLRDLPGIEIPAVRQERKHVHHLYTLKVRERERLMRELERGGIQTRVYYPVPIHLQEAYKDFGHKKGDFPVAEKLAQTVLAVPLYPELDEESVKYVAESIRSIFKE